MGRPPKTLPIKKNSTLTLVLSIIPGLAHLYLGKRGKALGLLVIDAGIFLTLIFSETLLMKVLMAGIYLVTFLPACLETYRMAQNRESWIKTDSKWYTSVLLLTTGFNALPLLWQSKAFSKRYKILWTLAVVVLAAGFFTVLTVFWNSIEDFLSIFFKGK